MLDNAEKYMWKYMFLHGAIIDREDYYGTSTDYEKTLDCRQRIKAVGISWKNTTGVKDGYDMKFNGTFCDSAKVTFLKGTLVLLDHSIWEWYYEYDEPINVLDLVKDFLPDPFKE